MAEDEDRPVVLGKAFEHAGELSFAFPAGDRLRGGGGVGGEQVAEALGDVREFLVQRDLAVEVAFLGSLVAPDFVGEDVAEDLAEPGGELGFVRAAEAGKGANGLDQGLLDDVRRIELGAEPAFHLGAGEQLEPGLEAAEEGIAGGRRAGAKRREQGIDVGSVHGRGGA